MTKDNKAGKRDFVRQAIAVVLSFALLPFAQWNLYAQAPYAVLDAEQLNQLVAPIALYPDSLVAQVLTASTYPDQVMEAENWSRQSGNMRPEDRASYADGMPWDPSVKALTAFPSVLETMARNDGWTRDLGNAYYNQPGDVMNAIQAMRIRARQAGVLRTTRECRVLYSGGLVVIEPVSPGFVYVPYYDPWVVYGSPLPMYRGWYRLPPPRGLVIGVGIGFVAAISIGLWSHYGWGWHAWSPNWRGGVVVYNRNTYISNSRTVVNYGHFGGYNRGVYERPGRGVPAGFQPPVTGRTAVFNRPGNAGAYRPGNTGINQPGVNRPSAGGYNRPGNAGAYRPGNSGVNQPGNSGVNRPLPNYNRPGNAGAYRPGNTGINRPSNSGVNRPNYSPNAGGNPPGPRTYRGNGGNGPISQPAPRMQQSAPVHQQQGGGQSHERRGGGQPHEGNNPSKGHK